MHSGGNKAPTEFISLNKTFDDRRTNLKVVQQSVPFCWGPQAKDSLPRLLCLPQEGKVFCPLLSDPTSELAIGFVVIRLCCYLLVDQIC
ncbi:MAG: hypothetical protein Kow00109_10030 [Acidobacteriota bacterium]